MSLEQKINELLDLRKMSLRGLSAATGLTTGTLYNIFTKNDAKLSQLQSLARALDVSLDVLVFRTGNGGTVKDEQEGTDKYGQAEQEGMFSQVIQRQRRLMAADPEEYARFVEEQSQRTEQMLYQIIDSKDKHIELLEQQKEAMERELARLRAESNSLDRKYKILLSRTGTKPDDDMQAGEEPYDSRQTG